MRKKKEPLNGNCFIVLTHTYRNHLDEFHVHPREISSFDEFMMAMHWHPEMAEAIGLPGDYHDKRHFNPRVSNVKLSIKVDGVETPLKDVEQLAAFLDSHPDVGDKLQYRPNNW